MTNNFLKFIKVVIIVALLLKFVLLPFFSHPYDFAAFVYQARNFFSYDISMLEHWNKSVFILLIWTPFYALYAQIIHYLGQVENIYILQFLFKFPLYIFDLMIGVLVYKMALYLSNDKQKSLMALLFYVVNPVSFYVVQIHGHYEIMMAFFVTLMAYWLLKKNLWYIWISLALWVGVKYWIVIFVPFILVYLYKQGCKLWKIILMFFVSWLFCVSLFTPYLSSQLLQQQFLSSIIWHATKADESATKEVNTIWYYALVSFPYYYLTGIVPNDRDVPYFAKLLYLFPILYLLLLFGFRKDLKKENREWTMIVYSILLIIIFFLLLPKFQIHYVVSLVPLVLLYGAVWGQKFVYTILFCLLFCVFLERLHGELWIRTYFLNLSTQLDSGFSLSVKLFWNYLPWFLTSVFMLILAVLVYLYKDEKNELIPNYYSIITSGVFFFFVLYFLSLSSILLGKSLASSNYWYLVSVSNFSWNFTSQQATDGGQQATGSPATVGNRQQEEIDSRYNYVIPFDYFLDIFYHMEKPLQENFVVTSADTSGTTNKIRINTCVVYTNSFIPNQCVTSNPEKILIEAPYAIKLKIQSKPVAYAYLTKHENLIRGISFVAYVYVLLWTSMTIWYYRKALS